MKAISLWQPWATLMAIGAKKNETRHWPTYWRGPLVLHAAKRFGPDERDICDDVPFREVLASAGILRPSDLPLGALVGVVRVVYCTKTETFGADLFEHGRLSAQEHAFGNYGPGRWAWITEGAKRFAVPIPWKGKQGFFDVPDDVTEATS